MSINFIATKANFDESCFCQKTYAEKHGFGYSLFTQVLNGTYASMSSPKALKVIAHLREAGILVEEDCGSANS